jgi:polyhydroxyalkanoate synthesis repressor PhaR
MIEQGEGGKKRLTLRKYPNRRYYDTSRSRYVTLEDIYLLIQNGYEIQVSDTKTGADITAKVLAQIILDLDPPKLDIFPIPLLHRLIRANEQLVNDFVERYFNQALGLFLDSQKSFEQSFRQSMGLQAMSPVMPEWLRRMWEPLIPQGRGTERDVSAGPSATVTPSDSPTAGASFASGSKSAPSTLSHQEMKLVVEELRHQIAALRVQLATHPKTAKSKSNGRLKKKPRRRGGKRTSHT